MRSDTSNTSNTNTNVYFWIKYTLVSVCVYLRVQNPESVVFGVFQFCKRCGLWKVLLALLVDVYGVWWMYGQIWTVISSVTLRYSFTK